MKENEATAATAAPDRGLRIRTEVREKSAATPAPAGEAATLTTKASVRP